MTGLVGRTTSFSLIRVFLLIKNVLFFVDPYGYLGSVKRLPFYIFGLYEKLRSLFFKDALE